MENKTLLGAGMQQLLTQEKHLDVMGLTTLDEIRLLVTLQVFRPTIIIFEQARLFTLSLKLWVEILDQPGIRVIAINTDNSRVQVYHKQQILITQVPDLLKLIVGEIG